MKKLGTYESFCMLCIGRCRGIVEMLTGYCIREETCALCGWTRDLAIVKGANNVR